MHLNKNIEERRKLLASPVYMSVEEVSLMPLTYVTTCSYDNLREDGLKFVHLLKKVGVRVYHTGYQNAVHGFIETVSSEILKKSWWLSKKTKK